MKRLLEMTLTAIIMATSMTAYGQPNSKTRPDKTVFLYRKSPVKTDDMIVGKTCEALGLEMQDESGLTLPEKDPANGNLEHIAGNARFDLYFPARPNGKMVITLPGGGYNMVCTYGEGTNVAEWMLSRGVTVAVLKYRIPNRHRTIPLEDVHNTLRYCREHAAEWGVEKIGTIGFSAGGHLAGMSAVHYTDKLTRPDFAILFYPVIDINICTQDSGTRINMTGKPEEWASTDNKSAQQWLEDQETYKELLRKYSVEKNVTPDTPPVFIVHCADDTDTSVMHSIMMCTELIRNGVRAEMHILPEGDHGFGFRSRRDDPETDRIGYARQQIDDCLERWIGSL